jgi:hypothetical protein
MHRSRKSVASLAAGILLVAGLAGCAGSSPGGSSGATGDDPQTAPAPATIAGPQFNVVDASGKGASTALSWSEVGKGVPECNSFAKKYPKYAVQFVNVTGTVTYSIEDAAAGSPPYSITVDTGIPQMGMNNLTVLGGICSNADSVGAAVGGKLLTWNPGNKNSFDFNITITWVSEKTSKNPDGDFTLQPEKTANVSISDVTAEDCTAAATNGFTTKPIDFHGIFCTVWHP